jgi:hypothetical protein
MKDRLNLWSLIIGIIAFIGTLTSWATDNTTALIISIALFILSISAMLIISIRGNQQPIIKIEKIQEEDLWISANRSNRLCVDSSFLSRDEGTLLFWILVPGRGEGLRDAPHNRYLISHQTGETSDIHQNAFFLRYSSESTWDFCFSNPNGIVPNDSGRYRQADTLTHGWHHVQISWNHSKPILLLLFDSGRGVNITSNNYLPYWPRKFDKCVYFGAWVSNYPDSYIETKLRQLWIVDGYLDAAHPEVARHISSGRQ